MIAYPPPRLIPPLQHLDLPIVQLQKGIDRLPRQVDVSVVLPETVIEAEQAARPGQPEAQDGVFQHIQPLVAAVDVVEREPSGRQVGPMTPETFFVLHRPLQRGVELRQHIFLQTGFRGFFTVTEELRLRGLDLLVSNERTVVRSNLDLVAGSSLEGGLHYNASQSDGTGLIRIPAGSG